jgi:hypothetical protein
MVRRVLVLVVLALLALPAAALAHPERPTQYPDAAKGKVPAYRTTGPSRVVCKPESRKLVRREFRKAPKRLRSRLAALKRCRYHDIQAAVDAARNGDRILVMPGTYREEPSRRTRHNDPACGPLIDPGDGHGQYVLYDYHLKCPTSRNLVFVGGDTDGDRVCDSKCNIQLEGMGRVPTDVKLISDRIKEDVIRADRADGFYLRNMSIQEGAFNGVDVVETNGFHLQDLVSHGNQHYGILSFTSDNGLYEDIEAYANGDSVIYPGSGPERHCKSYGIEIRRVNSYRNVLGYSGTAGNGTWTHDSKFHDNSAGISDDSFASGHPGMPQDCSKWEGNEVNSNNVNYFTEDNQRYCIATPFKDRPLDRVCPQFQVPVGAGFILYGVNDNIIRDNVIWDNWRSGIRLFWVPGTIRGDNSPEAQTDTSNGNQFIANRMGVRPDGTRDVNGVDVVWDGEGSGNCWSGNIGPGNGPITSRPTSLPACPGSMMSFPGNLLALAEEVPCATWNAQRNPFPVGCAWFDTPPEPR